MKRHNPYEPSTLPLDALPLNETREAASSHLHPNETVARESAANLQRGAETVGGRLFLTDKRLLFKAHSFNVQKGSTELHLEDIIQTRPCWTKFLNLIPLFPNSLVVETNSGQVFRFVLPQRMSWKAAIEAALPSR